MKYTYSTIKDKTLIESDRVFNSYEEAENYTETKNIDCIIQPIEKKLFVTPAKRIVKTKFPIIKYDEI
jgi:hypothetical protein